MAATTLPLRPNWSRRVSSPEMLGTPRSQRHPTTRQRTRSLPELFIPSECLSGHTKGSVRLPSVSRRSSRQSMEVGEEVEAEAELPGQQAATLEEQRFTRMMERFQLRRVPSTMTSTLASGYSRGRHAPVSTTGRSSRRSITGMPSTVAGPPLQRKIKARMAQTSVKTTLRRAIQQCMCAALDAVVHSTVPQLSTCGPSSTLTRARLSMLTAAFTAKLLFTPFTIAYYQASHTWAQAIYACVDAVFVLNILGTCNTETVDAKRRVLCSRQAIWRHYRRHGFLLDGLTALPFEYLFLTGNHSSGVHWVVGLARVAMQSLSVRRHLRVFYAAWAKEAMGQDKNATGTAWLLFSRYSHLLRIGRIVLSIVLVAHYFACMWSWVQLDADRGLFGSEDVLMVHIYSLYDALQLMQGQGIVAKTPEQALFGSVALLLGSIAVAVMFANVAILVSNFSANTTAYQRKMEQVFSIMGKLELPHPIRERVHQYYEYLHVEYESLDGEVVKFAKDLSHTLELEVVLFKYMDVLMQVPHWRGCSPDFQKQLVLSLNVRIYLPDDFIMRRGEVGTECYLINRGTCKLCVYPSGNYEPPTIGTGVSDEHGGHESQVMATARVREAALTEVEALHNGLYSEVRVLNRGQAVGDLALLANYERTSDLRAVGYVEMCVIERKSFQWLLMRYPKDRQVVVTSIVRRTMESRDEQNLPCVLRNMVQQFDPQASMADAVRFVVTAMDPPEDDPSIVFGISGQLLSRIRGSTQTGLRRSERAPESARSVQEPAPALPSSKHSSEAVQAVLQEIQDGLTRLEMKWSRREDQLLPVRQR